MLAKEVERAGRFGYPISLILFDVDQLSAINQEHGYGVGDKILERLGILIRQYFRQHDWVARHSEDSIAVLLTRTDADDASELAERVRATVEERLGFTDHRTDRPVHGHASAPPSSTCRSPWATSSIPSGCSPTRKPRSSARSSRAATASSASTATRARCAPTPGP